MRCDLCAQEMPSHGHYVVRIDVFADPSVPPVSAEQLAAADFDSDLERLLKEMENLTEHDLQDQVHRRFEYRICQPCQVRFLATPLGKPWKRKEGEN
jgi:hypothetical protein